MKPVVKQDSYFESLYYQKRGMMFKAVCKYVYEPDMREDVFQEAFIRIMKCEDKLRNMSQEETDAFIIFVIRYAAIDYYRKMRPDNTIAFDNDILLNIIARKEADRASGVGDLGKVDLAMMMQQLPQEDQLLLVGKYYIGLSIAELCDIVGGSSEKIRTRLFRAKERVLVLWQKSGLNMEDFLNG